MKIASNIQIIVLQIKLLLILHELVFDKLNVSAHLKPFAKVLEENRTCKLIFKYALRQKEFRDDIQIGDEVYIWRADGNAPGTAGVVAQGVIISLPRMIKDGAPELWIEPQPSDTVLRVLIAIGDVRLRAAQGMLLKTDLRKDSLIGEMAIITTPRKTNYRIGEKHARKIMYLWAIADPRTKLELDDV